MMSCSSSPTGCRHGPYRTHAEPTLAAVLPTLRAEGLSIAPLAVVRHGRVAIGDAIAALLGADCVAVLIGDAQA